MQTVHLTSEEAISKAPEIIIIIWTMSTMSSMSSMSSMSIIPYGTIIYLASLTSCLPARPSWPSRHEALGLIGMLAC